MARKPISKQKRYQILERDDFTCQVCGVRAPNATLQVDHMIAVANGGSDDDWNLQAICITCNIGKGALEPNVVAIGARAKYPIRISDNDVRISGCGEALGEPVYWIGEQWAVTAFGVECRDGTYFIERDRLWQDEENWGWKKHMSEKDWVDSDDFGLALDWARQHFIGLKPKKRPKAG